MAAATEELGPLISNKTAYEVTRPLVHSAIAFIIVDTLIVIAKTYSRLYLAKLRFWWDDFWIIVAWATLMPLCGLALAMPYTEVAWNNEDRIIYNLDELEYLLKYIFAILQILIASFAATRYSIMAFYLRIFHSDYPENKWIRRSTWAMIIFVGLQWTAFGIAAIFQCQPVQYFWNRRIEGGKCFDINTFYRSLTPFNIFIDLVLVLLPLPTVWRLKASNVRKSALTLLFAIGVVALVASAIRLSVYAQHTATVIAPSYTNIMVMWLVIEPSIYLIVVCLPAMHHIFAAVVPKGVASWMAQKVEGLGLTRLSDTVLRRSKTTGNMSLASETDCRDHEMVMELGNRGHGGRSVAHIVPVSTKGRKRDGNGGRDSEDCGMLNKGIVVTNEVTITYTQEQMIERIIGF